MHLENDFLDHDKRLKVSGSTRQSRRSVTLPPSMNAANQLLYLEQFPRGGVVGEGSKILSIAITSQVCS